MTIRSLSLFHYRCFRHLSEMQMGRLSLVYGVNSSGKSALVRLPALLAGSLRGGIGLDLTHGTLSEAPFKELVWDHGGDGELLQLGFTDADGGKWSWEFEWIEPLGEPVIRSFSAPTTRGPETWTWAPVNRKETGPTRTYTRASDKQPHAVHWLGLLPELEGVDVAALKRLRDGVVWLTTSRVPPSRDGVSRGVRPPMDPRGGAWAEALCAQDEALRAAVSRWYEDHVSHVLAVTTLEGKVRLRLRAKDRPAPDVSFPDVGEGLQQVFPVLVALELLRRNGGVLCIEEPEAHLHPTLQRALADRIVSVLTEQQGAQILMETHSEVLLYEALLHAVRNLEGDVRITWLEPAGGEGTRLRAIELDDQGRPRDDILRRSFEALGALRREVLEARRRHAR